MRDIFISYVEEDNPITTELAAGLEAAGFSTWYYERDGEPGASYLLQTRIAIDQCQAFVLLISPDSVTSEQVTLEIVRAHETNKPFFPLRWNISHAEFTNRRPEWAQALGAATSVTIPPEGAAALVPRLLRGLEKLSINPKLQPTGPLKVPAGPRKSIDQATGKLQLRTAAPPSPPAPPIARQSVKPALRKKLFLMIAAAALIAVLLGGWALLSLRDREPPLTKDNPRDLFDNLDKWVRPSKGWSVGNGRLEIKDAPEIGYLAKEWFGDFTLAFQLKLLNEQGAAWALRVRKNKQLFSEETCYYLFHLAGPGGMYHKNQFLAYRVCGAGEPQQLGTTFNVPVGLLKANGSYTITALAEKGHFYHEIVPDDVPGIEQHEQLTLGEKLKLGDHRDEENALPRGSIGFRTLRNEHFAIGNLFVYPPGVNPLQ